MLFFSLLALWFWLVERWGRNLVWISINLSCVWCAEVKSNFTWLIDTAKSRNGRDQINTLKFQTARRINWIWIEFPAPRQRHCRDASKLSRQINNVFLIKCLQSTAKNPYIVRKMSALPVYVRLFFMQKWKFSGFRVKEFFHFFFFSIAKLGNKCEIVGLGTRE